MIVFLQFLQFNLLPSLCVGAVAWLLILMATRYLSIQSANLRLGLYVIPLAKSVLLLLGIGLIFPWPRELFLVWHRQALPPEQVAPFLLAWAVLVTATTTVLVRRARQALLAHAHPAPPRLNRALGDVLPVYRQALQHTSNNGLRCAPLQAIRPLLLVSDRLVSPVAVTAGGKPTIVFPAGLLDRLDDQELGGALVHELTHFSLRWPGWCSVGLLRKLAAVSPVAGLVIANINREEERACDEMAVRVTDDATGYAQMLLKSYRYAKEQGNPLVHQLRLMPHLLGLKPGLTDRIESLLQTNQSASQPVQALLTCLLWVLFSSLFFVS